MSIPDWLIVERSRARSSLLAGPGPPPPPGPQPVPFICFSLPQTWCNQFNLSLDKYDSLGNGYYYGTHSHSTLPMSSQLILLSSLPNSVIRGAHLLNTLCRRRYVVLQRRPRRRDVRHLLPGHGNLRGQVRLRSSFFVFLTCHSFYWNMTSSLIGQSTVVFRQDRNVRIAFLLLHS